MAAVLSQLLSCWVENQLRTGHKVLQLLLAAPMENNPNKHYKQKINKNATNIVYHFVPNFSIC